MKDKVFFGIQLLAGLMLVVFGLNKFLHFIPMAPPPGEMGVFMGALFATGYLFPLIAVIEVLAGIAFLTNKYTPIMAIILMPVMVNASLAHLFLDPAGIGGAAFLTIATVIVMIRHKDRYNGLCEA